MWLYVPQYEQYPSVPVSEALTWASHSLASTASVPRHGLCATSNGKPMLRPFSWRGWKARPWRKLLSGVTSDAPRLTYSLVMWMRSLEEFHASLTRQPGSKADPLTSETSGHIPSGSSLRPEQTSCSSRTSLDSEQRKTDYRESLRACRAGGMHNGELFPAKDWAPRTAEKGSSSWPTISAVSYGSNRGGAAGRSGQPERPSLQSLLGQNWPTPAAWDWKNGTGQESRKKPGLAALGHQWPTPIARNAKREAGARKSPTLSSICHSGHLQESRSDGSESTPVSGQAVRRRLNTNFVSWLMGFPIGWGRPMPLGRTSFEAWEMQLVHQLELWLGPCCAHGPSHGRSAYQEANDGTH